MKSVIESQLAEGNTAQDMRRNDRLLLAYMEEMNDKLDRHIERAEEYYKKIDRIELERKVGAAIIAGLGGVALLLIDHIAGWFHK